MEDQEKKQNSGLSPYAFPMRSGTRLIRLIPCAPHRRYAHGLASKPVSSKVEGISEARANSDNTNGP